MGNQRERKTITNELSADKERAERIETVGIRALRRAKEVHDELGEDGLTPVPSPNQFNEQALKVDVEAEMGVIEVLGESGLPIRLRSEEHGITELSENPELFGVLDGVDGTTEYRKGRGILRYGTMLGIASGVDPRYDDYIFSGIMEHAADRLWIGIKGQGSFLVDPNGNRTRIHASPRMIFDKSTRIYSMSPDYNETARRHLTGLVKEYQTQLGWSEAIVLADVASSEFDIAVEATRKGNLEQMAAFGLVTGAGGVMVDKNGKSIGNQRYLDWGQKESLLLVTASTQKLAEDFLKKLKNLNKDSH